VVLFLGPYILKNGKEGPWFVALSARGLMLFRSGSRDELRDSVQRIFYLDRVRGQSVDEIWEEGSLAEVLGRIRSPGLQQLRMRRLGPGTMAGNGFSSKRITQWSSVLLV
jgi:hypothetical protein